MDLQTLQTIFYSLGIVVMTLGLLLLIAIAVILFYIRKKVNDIHREAEERLSALLDQARPVGMAAEAGAAIAGTALQAVKNFKKKKKK